MLFASVGMQHAAPYHKQNSLRPGRNSVRFQHRRCTMVQPRHSKPVQVLAANDASTAGASSKSSSSSRIFFHDRETERKALKEHCSSPPDAISVILGPRSAGKTALLEDYMRSSGLADSRCFIDARVTPISNPSDLARALLDSVVPDLVRRLPDVGDLADVAKQLIPAVSMQDRLKLPGGIELTANILKGLPGEPVPALSKVTAVYLRLLDAWDKAGASGELSDASPPVLVIDEANRLLSWGNQYRAEREDLLNFFVSITKVKHRSHVVLATSEYAFQNWLNEENISGFYTTFVVGDFPKEQARRFFDKCLQQHCEPEVSDSVWKDVHEVCGGNAGDLLLAAGFYHRLGGWEAARIQLTKDRLMSMKPGRLPALDAGYTATDYATAVKDILDSDHNAVEDVGLAAKLGKQALDAMVRANLLALRSYSSWAADIDDAAFGPDQSFTVVTAPTALHLYLMKRHRNVLLKPLEAQQVPAQANTDNSTYSSRPPSPTSQAVRAVNDIIQEVQGIIEDVEKGIKQVSSEMTRIREAKGEGWQDELARLQQDKQQLAERERQLREDKRLLQEEKLLLMKREEKNTRLVSLLHHGEGVVAC